MNVLSIRSRPTTNARCAPWIKQGRPRSREAELGAYGPATVAELLAQDGNAPDKWEHLMTVPMRFNRLILYRPWLWHSAGEPFGASLEDGRLVQLVGFQAPR